MLFIFNLILATGRIDRIRFQLTSFIDPKSSDVVEVWRIGHSCTVTVLFVSVMNCTRFLNFTRIIGCTFKEGLVKKFILPMYLSESLLFFDVDVQEFLQELFSI